MTSAAYETSTFPPLSSAHDVRRPIGGSSYDLPYSTSRRRSPSPGPSSRRYAPYDSYVPRGGPSYRSEDHQSNCRPNAWRLERYNSRSPSPDRYDRSRPTESRFWDSGFRFHPSWQDRRSSPSPPPLREKVRRDTMAERMFEPSDSWKQSHIDRSGRYEALDPTNLRFTDYRARPARDYSPQRSPVYPPVHGDTYRPYSGGQNYRDLHAFARSDSYRPQYDDSPWRSPRSGDKSNTDAYPRRPSSHYDHDETWSSTSIASTPPRPAVDLRVTDCDPPRCSPSCRHTSPLSVARSRASSISSEPPRKRLKSRSSSRSSASSRADKSVISACNRLNEIVVSPRPNRETTIQQAPADVSSRDRDRPAFVRECTPNPYARDCTPNPYARDYTPNPYAPDSIPNSYPCASPNPYAPDYKPNSYPCRTPNPHAPDHKPDPGRTPNPYACATPNPYAPDFTPSSYSCATSNPCAKTNSFTGKGSTHAEPLPHELPHVDPVINSELNGPHLGLNCSRSPPSLLSGEDIEMSPPGLIASHSLPNIVDFAFFGDSTRPGTKIRTIQATPPFDGVHTQSISPGVPSPALKSVEVVNDESAVSGTVVPLPQETQAEKIDAHSSQISKKDTPLLKSVPHVFACESINSPFHGEGGEQHMTPPLDLEQPAAWCYDRSPAESNTKALRLVVLTRLQCDRQTRDERVIPVLRANQAIREPSLPSPTDAQDKLFKEFAADRHYQDGMAFQSQSIRKSLSAHFQERETVLREKQRKLREEYFELHQLWMAQCARLDNASKGGLPEESMPPSAGGRSTRRSAAVLGDAVRSDLEMEQIIANLGMEELTDPSYLAIKNVAKIPDMISVTNDYDQYCYDDTNNLLDDPAEFYSASSGLDLWTEEECSVFKEKYAAHPKQFGLIAEHLPNKTAAQCVTYYYLHKKQHVDFRKAIAQYGAGRRRRNGKGAKKQKGNALLADIRRHDDELLAANPSEFASSCAAGGKRRRAAILRSNGEPRRYNSRRGTVQPEQTPTSSGTTPDPDVEEQKRRRRSIAVVRSSGLAQEEAEPCPPELETKAQSTKQNRKARKPRARTIPIPSEDATPAPELSDCCKSSSTPIPWSKEDKNVFIGLLSQHGHNVQRIAASMPHKTAVQVSSYYKSFTDELASVSPEASTL